MAPTSHAPTEDSGTTEKPAPNARAELVRYVERVFAGETAYAPWRLIAHVDKAIEEARDKYTRDLEAVLSDIFDDMTGHPNYDPYADKLGTIPVNVTHVGTIAVLMGPKLGGRDE